MCRLSKLIVVRAGNAVVLCAPYVMACGGSSCITSSHNLLLNRHEEECKYQQASTILVCKITL